MKARSCMIPSSLCVPLAGLLLFLSTSSVASAQAHWVGSWATSQQVPDAEDSLPINELEDATLRQIVHMSIGGSGLRVQLSNRFGTAPLHFTAVHIARPVAANSAKIVAGTDRALTFSGAPDVTIPAGADYLSDPVAIPVAPLSDLAITLHLDLPPPTQTGHPGSRATSYLVHGNLVSAADLLNAREFDHWYFISAVDVRAPSEGGAVVILGDSITDGHAATTNGNDRWPDALARRLQADPATKMLGVLNQGIGGNRLLLNQTGPNALARFDYDVLAQAGVRYLIVLEGINDLGMLTRDAEVPQAEHDTLVHGIIAAYEQIIARAHTHGIKVFGGTIMPDGGCTYYHPGPRNEADRQAINKWIRERGHFDAVIDFDKAMRDPQHPDRLLPAYDSGDHIHPSPAGYKAMAAAVPLSLFSVATAVESRSNKTRPAHPTASPSSPAVRGGQSAATLASSPASGIRP